MEEVAEFFQHEKKKKKVKTTIPQGRIELPTFAFLILSISTTR